MYKVYYVHKSTLYTEEQLKVLVDRFENARDNMIPVVLFSDLMEDERKKHD